MSRIEKTDDDWRRELTPDQYRIMRQKGTEPPFTGEYVNEKTPGVYRCAACGTPLFRSDTKYDSGSGWPSFYAPIDEANVETEEDRSHGMRRTEVMCATCEAHLGHVFPDGPRPTGLRYCVNSASLTLDPETKGEE
ncbi:MAG TPA: peptide-methionine (R)-S-oxide reductase MsrB [Longimicrobiales bacterium]|nr:peptide-methionine (R)-S-oxide reductase MsrB [Longimicrobiales bacterium]